MDLDNVTVAIRPRRSWESIDLGLRLARSCPAALWGAFAPVYLLFVGLAWLLLGDTPWLAALAIWWAKPWYDRVALHVLSRAVFGETPSLRETLRALPGMYRKGALAAVLHMRFDAARSLNLALWQLERLPWARWRRRVQLIENPVRRTAGWYTVTCVALEGIVVAALFALVYALIPPSALDAVALWLESLADVDAAADHAALGAWILAVGIVEPLYVAGGFGLYLNRRTELEGWDLEIAFRRMARRHAGGDARAAA